MSKNASNNLVAKALLLPRAERPGQELSTEDVGLAHAWAIGRVSFTQVCRVKKLRESGPDAYVYLARCLRRFVREMPQNGASSNGGPETQRPRVSRKRRGKT
jgi:hypothetical protein